MTALAHDLLAGQRVVPVVVLDDDAQAAQLGRSLADGGLRLVEVTLRTPAAIDGIRVLSSAGQVVVGAGSVVTPEQVDRVVEAGARFIVSPGFSLPIVERARAIGVPVIPGVATASEILSALAAGLDVLKYFPAESLGGPAALRALSAPFPGLRFVPTGGVSPDNMDRYLALPSVVAVGGSWMVERSLIREGRWDEVTERTRAAVAKAAESTTGPEVIR